MQSNSMQNTCCVITGATSGIGKAAATALANSGADVFIIGRSETRGNRISAQLNRQCGRHSARFVRCDLSSMNQVRDLAAEICSVTHRVDVLINNAGARFDTFRKSADGIEMTFATNHLGHFLLTALLVERLESSPRPRVINVSGQNHWKADADFDAIVTETNYDRTLANAKSKLANLMFAYELADRLKGKGIVANAVHPGGVATRLGMNNSVFSWMRHIVSHLLHRDLISARRGADTIVYLAAATEVAGVTGNYFYNRKPIQSSQLSHDRAARQKLWDLSVQLTGANIGDVETPGH